MGQDLRNTIFYDSVSTNGGDLRMGHNKNGLYMYLLDLIWLKRFALIKFGYSLKTFEPKFLPSWFLCFKYQLIWLEHFKLDP
jgi:hypothetical protein